MSQRDSECRAATGGRPPRVLFAPLNIANNWWSVSRALRSRGVHADVATVERSPLVAPGDFDLTFPVASAPRKALKKAAFCARALRYYDVFHYEFGHSIFEYRPRPTWLMDLRAASALGKPLLMTFHGSDVRGTRIGSDSLGASEEDIEAKRRRLALVRRHVKHLFVTTPDLLLDVPEAQWVPQAVDAVRTAVPAEPKTSGALVVTHAPSRRGGKGTHHVIAACQTLQARGHAIELQLIENMEHDEALRAYRRADIAIDQLLVGWYGVFAVEMMALGKPVVCYIDRAHMRAAGVSDLPIINARPDTLVEVLEALIRQRHELPRLGAAGRQYAQAVHDPLVVAGRYLQVYSRLAPSSGLEWPGVNRVGEAELP